MIIFILALVGRPLSRIRSGENNFQVICIENIVLHFPLFVFAFHVTACWFSIRISLFTLNLWDFFFY